MSFNGPRFGPRGAMNNPRFKQFPPHMQPRMHYGPRQHMRPRQPNSNNFNQNRPQNNNQHEKPIVPINKPIDQPEKPIMKPESPKAPQVQKLSPKMEIKVETNSPKPQSQKPNVETSAPIKVVTSTSNVHEQQPKPPQNISEASPMNKPKSNTLMQTNTNGNYSNQRRDNQYSNMNEGRNNDQGNRMRNQSNYQQGRQEYNKQGENQYSTMNEGRNIDQGNRMRNQSTYQQGRQDYNKIGDKNLKPYFSNDRVRDRVRQIAGPQIDLPPLDMSEKKFNSYSRLFVGNLQKNITQEDLQIVFSKYGEIGQIYVNKEASYAFINFDFKANALKAMKELDNTMIKGRAIKVRIAAISDGIRVKNLAPTISNELLERAFSIFGNVESCRIIVDDRGMPTGEGVVIFKDKKTAFLAVKKCQEECYILSGTARPVVVAPIEQSETNEEGLPEASLQKHDDYMRERSVGPHFAAEGSFETELGQEWKKVYQVNEERKKALEAEFQYDKERIEKKLVLARVEFEKEKLRKELAAREAESAHLRRHFDADPTTSSKTYSEGNEALPYESYGSAKRPAEAAYDSSYSGSYDPAYKESYDRSYGRDYDRGYGREYERTSYGGYNREGAYERGYEMPPAEIPSLELSERSKYDLPPLDPHFDMAEGYSAYERPSTEDAYKPNKRPRY